MRVLTVRKPLLLIVIAGLVLVLFSVVTLHYLESSLLHAKHSSPVQSKTCNCEYEHQQQQLTNNEHEQVNWIASSVNVANMSPKQIKDYLNFTNRSSCALINDFGGTVFRYEHTVAIDGQKSVCLERGKAPVADNCLVYSFGINYDWSFDDAMAKYGCQVFSFDPSMREGDHDRSANVHFYNMGLGNRDSVKDNGWKIKRLASIYEMLANNGKHSPDAVIDYLKMDIEFDEWLVLPELISSGMIYKVRQLGVEVHFFHDPTLDEYRRLVGILKAVEDTGMIRFDSEYNPWSVTNIPAFNNSTEPCAFELAWYRLI